MTNETDTFAAYLDRIPSASPLAEMCREVVQGEMLPMTDSIHFGLEEGVVMTVVPVFWLWAGIYLDALRNRKESQEVEYRLNMILRLQEQGYSRTHAERLVEKMLNAVGKRNKEDPAIKSLLQIVKVVKGLEPQSHIAELIETDAEHTEP